MSNSDTKVGPKDVRFRQVSLYINKGCSILTLFKLSFNRMQMSLDMTSNLLSFLVSTMACAK